MTCWVAQMKPFDPEHRDDEEVVTFQAKSIANGVCGMGWDLEGHFSDKNQTYWLADNNNKENYKAAYRNRFSAATDKSGFAVALNQYARIKPGDYILTRLFATSVCWIGKVTSYAYYDVQEKFKTDNGCYSWIVDVDWTYHAPFLTLPDALRGLMQTHMITIKRVYSGTHCSIMQKLCGESVEPIGLTAENFHESLDSNSLEDLVAFYIMESHKGFRLLPSTCKANEQTFEFLLENGDLKITCQVKNMRKIDVVPYTDESLRKFDRIYLFSGLGYDNEPQASNNIRIIPREDLYHFLKLCYMNKDHFYNILKDFYVFKD